MKARNCRTCGKPSGGLYADYCTNCRWRARGKPPMYVWTPERDDLLRRRYDSRVRGRASEIAQALGWPAWAVKRRATVLGLSHPRGDYREWTSAEEAFLEEHAGLRVVDWMAKKLKRGRTSVVLKLKRMQLSRRIREGYTLRDLQECFGIDHHGIDRWIREGKLKGTRRYDNGNPSHDAWVFTDGNVRTFIRENPTAFRLDKVDQLWFMDLILHKRPTTSHVAA